MDKNIEYVLVLVGVALLTLGMLNVFGYVKFQLVDTTPPDILYTYPQASSLYKTTEIDEYVVYAKDAESLVTSAYYTDTYNSAVNLEVTPYVQLKHPMTVIRNGIICKFPDVNFDGKVDDVDLNLVGSIYGATEGSANYNSAYDINSDGDIGGDDITIVAKYRGTVTFSATPVMAYTPGNVTFAFSVKNQENLVTTLQSSFEIQDYTLLSGNWSVNDVAVNTSSRIDIETRKATIKFVCDDKTVPEASISVKVQIGDAVYYLDKTASYTWQKEIELAARENYLILSASTQTSVNKISVTVVTPEGFNLTIGHELIIAGSILIVAGIVLWKREKDMKW
jgi:hypothetical protein